MEFGESTSGFTTFVPEAQPATDRPAIWSEDGPMFIVALKTWISQDEDGEVDYAVPPFPFILGRINILRDVN